MALERLLVAVAVAAAVVAVVMVMVLVVAAIGLVSAVFELSKEQEHLVQVKSYCLNQKD